mmetsp:Transcript_6943/g.15085  ORF Transcript_6943/g.15085 Transcript_6943/m.15085 type:complete len:122 (-) Transcript_6943:336-701(-)
MLPSTASKAPWMSRNRQSLATTPGKSKGSIETIVAEWGWTSPDDRLDRVGKLINVRQTWPTSDSLPRPIERGPVKNRNGATRARNPARGRASCRHLPHRSPSQTKRAAIDGSRIVRVDLLL